MPFTARAVKMRRFTPMTPTIERPVTVMRVVPLMLDMPLMALRSLLAFSFIIVPGLLGLKVFFTLMGMFFTHTGYIVGGYITFAPKLHSSIASL